MTKEEAGAQHTPLDRSKWEGCEYCLTDKSILAVEISGGVVVYEEDITLKWEEEPRYCPICGKPLTEDTWAELERRVSGE